MNVSDYKAAGYPLSQYIDQASVTRAEADIMQAYIVPLLGHSPTAEELATDVIKEALMSCAFLLIMQRSAVATRAGGKVKQTPQSFTPTYDDVLRQNAPTCALKLETLAGTPLVSKRVQDICGIFFTSSFSHI